MNSVLSPVGQPGIRASLVPKQMKMLSVSPNFAYSSLTSTLFKDNINLEKNSFSQLQLKTRVDFDTVMLSIFGYLLRCLDSRQSLEKEDELKVLPTPLLDVSLPHLHLYYPVENSCKDI